MSRAMSHITVLGGGNGSHAAVVDLTLKGFDVMWWRRPGRRFPDGGTIRYSGIHGDGSVTVATTNELGVALAHADLVIAPLPATVQHELLDAAAGSLTDQHVVAWLPGTFGTWLGALRAPAASYLEVGTLPYLARKVADGEVAIPVVARRLPTGAIPGEGSRADRAHELFAAAYPSAVRVSDGFDAALTNWGPVIHPPLIVHNLGAIQSLGDRFDIHAEGTSPAVQRAILTLDDERTALREHLGVPGETWPIATHYDRSPLGMYPSDGHQRLIESNLWREAIDLDHRYIWEDVACGLVLNASIGRASGLAMPQSEAILTLLASALGVDWNVAGRTLRSLGIEDLDAARRELAALR